MNDLVRVPDYVTVNRRRDTCDLSWQCSEIAYMNYDEAQTIIDMLVEITALQTQVTELEASVKRKDFLIEFVKTCAEGLESGESDRISEALEKLEASPWIDCTPETMPDDETECVAELEDGKHVVYWYSSDFGWGRLASLVIKYMPIPIDTTGEN